MKNINLQNLKLQNTENTALEFTENDTLSTLLTKAEKHVIQLAIERCKGNQSAAAEALGISRGTLRTKLLAYFGNKYFKTII